MQREIGPPGSGSYRGVCELSGKIQKERKKETLLVSFIFGSPFLWMVYSLCFLCGSDGEESVCSAGDPGLILGLGRCPGEGNGNPLQYSCLENSMDRGAWWATVHGITKSQTQLSDYTCMLSCFYHLWGLLGGASGDSTWVASPPMLWPLPLHFIPLFWARPRTHSFITCLLMQET